MKVKESYLHFLFDNRVLGNSFTTVDGSPIEIIEFGILNKNAGPDFLDAKIKFDNKIWAGHIEFHVKSSDWNLHKHQFDPNYNNVILHMVYQFDEDIFINKFKLPTVQIKSKISESNYLQYLSFYNSKKKIPCHLLIEDVNSIIINAQIESAFHHRVERKVLEALKLVSISKGDYSKMYLGLLAKQFGGKVNSHAFMKLVGLFNYNLISILDYNLFKIEALLFGLAGFLNEDSNDEYHSELHKEFEYLRQVYNLVPMGVNEWKFSRMFVNGFPTYRIAQFSALLTNSNLFSNEFLYENVRLSLYWKTHYNFGKKSKRIKDDKLSNDFINLIKINVVLIYTSAMLKLKDNNEVLINSGQILSSLKPDNNSVIKYWNEIGVKAKNALESQGLIEQLHSFCSEKKCLTCLIGKDLLLE